jgi:hypothetical protein
VDEIPLLLAPSPYHAGFCVSHGGTIFFFSTALLDFFPLPPFLGIRKQKRLAVDPLKTFDQRQRPNGEVFRFFGQRILHMFSPRLVLPWRERLQKEAAEEEAAAKKKKRIAKLHEDIQHLSIKVFEAKEKTDQVKALTAVSRMHDICENGRKHFRTKAKWHTLAELAINPADRELYSKLYSKVDEKIWRITETRAWYDNVFQPADELQGRCGTSLSTGLTLPSHRIRNVDRQRPTRAQTARNTQGNRYLQVATHFKDAWHKESL